MQLLKSPVGIAALFAATVLAPAGTANAAGLVVLPNAVSYAYFGLNFADNIRTSNTVGTLNYNGQPGCSGTCTATTTLGGDPSVSATVAEEEYFFTSGGVVQATLGYYVEYLNAPGTYAVTLKASDKLYAPDGQAVSAGLTFGQADDRTSSFNNFKTVDFDEGDCLNRCPAPGFVVATGPFVPTKTLQLIANTPYFIQMNLYLNPGPTKVQIGAAIDPTFSDNGAGGTFAFSPGVFQAVTGGVPEPATWAMMIGGFALIGATMRRQRRTQVGYA